MLKGKVPVDFDELYPRLYPVIALIARGKMLDWWIFKQYGRFRVTAKLYYPEQPRTGKQQGWKSVFYDAVKGWQGFDIPTKQYYNALKRPNVMSGYNRYLKFYLEANYPMIIYWDPLKQSATHSVTIPDYISSDYFGGVGRIFSDTSYPASPPYGAMRYRSDLKKWLGFKEGEGWSEIGGEAVEGLDWLTVQVFS